MGKYSRIFGVVKINKRAGRRETSKAEKRGNLKTKATVINRDMGELSCPQCGNPQLDVDEQNSVVYCKKCGFAVKVDPQTGNVTPISQGGVPQSAKGPGTAPAAYSAGKSVLGMEPFTFFMLGTAFALLLAVSNVLPLELFGLLEVIVVIIWFMNK